MIRDVFGYNGNWVPGTDTSGCVILQKLRIHQGTKNENLNRTGTKTRSTKNKKATTS